MGEVTLALDGTKILANASKHSAVSHGHATAQMALLEDQIAALLQKADDADSTPLDDGLSVPAESSGARSPKGGAFVRRAAPAGAGNWRAGRTGSKNCVRPPR